MTARRYATAFALLVTAAVVYAGVPWEWILDTSLNPARSFLSELAALDQAESAYFRVLDSIAGAAILAAAVVLWSTVRGFAARAAVVALGTFGLGTILDIVFPMKCATSVSEACAALEAEGKLGLSHQIHTYASVLADSAAVVVAAMVLIVAHKLHLSSLAGGASQGSGPRPHASLVLAVRVTSAVSIGASIVVTVMAITPAPGELLPVGTGYVQRIQTLAFCVMLVLLAPLLRRIFTRAPEKSTPLSKPVAYCDAGGSPGVEGIR